MALDDSTANLERFIGQLTMATGALEQVSEHLVEATDQLTDLQDQSVDECGGLNESLEEMETQLETSGSELRDALEEVAQAGADAQEVLAESQAQLERAAGDFEEKAEAAGADLDEEHARLTEQGFEALGRTVGECEQELEAAGRESEGSFEAVQAGLENSTSEAQTSWDAAEAALEQGASELAGHESSLQVEADECAQGFNAAAEDIANACSSLEGGLGTTYDGCAGEVDSQGQELLQALQELAQETVTFVETGGRERLDEPARMVETEALGPLSEEYTALEGALDSAVALADNLAPLTDELVKCRAIVGEIAALLNAME